MDRRDSEGNGEGFDLPLSGSTSAISAATRACAAGGASIAGLPPSPPAPPAPGGGDAAEIRALLAAIYDPYTRGGPGDDVMPEVLMTPDLARLEAQAGEDGIGADPFCGCQDWENARYAIRSVQVNGHRAEAQVSFTNFGATALITLRLARTAAGWRVDDVVHPDFGSLRTLLRQ